MTLIVILAAAQAPDTQAWNRALAEAHVPATISQADLLRQGGFLPVTVDGKPTGFEFYRSEDFPEIAAHYPAVSGLKVSKPVIYSFRYGGRFEECAAVFYTASVLVSRFGGTALETEAGITLKEGQLVEFARQCQEESRNQPE